MPMQDLIKDSKMNPTPTTPKEIRDSERVFYDSQVHSCRKQKPLWRFYVEEDLLLEIQCLH